MQEGGGRGRGGQRREEGGGGGGKARSDGVCTNPDLEGLQVGTGRALQSSNGPVRAMTHKRIHY